MTHPILNDIDRSLTLCFTGHRPEKLPRDPRALYQCLHYHIGQALAQGYRCFLDGLADGVDYAAVMSLTAWRRDYPDLTVIGVQPCEDYEEFYLSRGYDAGHLSRMRANLDRHIILPGSYRKGSTVFLARNRFMADHSSAIIAVCGAGRSGSDQALRYARKRALLYLRIDSHTVDAETPEDWVAERCGL